MKRIFSSLIMLLATVSSVHACTTFCLQRNGKKVFGRNYDWVTGTGMIHSNLRGLNKIALTTEKGKPLTWTSRYGSITFNQYGKEFPNGGMNEKGLVVELMWLKESAYPAPDERPSLSVLQWIQYQLDNASTIEEVIASDKKVRIFSTGTPQHYLIADSKGGVATIEFIKGKMIVHTDKTLPYPVLANSTYASSLSSYKNNSSPADNSLQRFSQACEMIKAFEVKNISTPLVDYAFNILDKVALGDYTKWSIVYDIDERNIHFSTTSGERRSLAFDAFSFSCEHKAKFYNMQLPHKGNINSYFQDFSYHVNSSTLKKAFYESRAQVNVPSFLQEMMAKIPEALVCSN